MRKKSSSKMSHFRSVAKERRFWETHDAFATLGEEGWEVVEAGTPVRSLYVVRVGRHGVLVRVPKEFFKPLKIKNGQKLRVWTEGHKLVLEALK